MKTVLFTGFTFLLFGIALATECYSSRPSFIQLITLLNNEIQWMGPKFFHGAHPLLITEGLTLARDIKDLSLNIGMTPDNEQNFQRALGAIPKGDEQYFLDLGMTHCSWNEVRYVFQQLLDSGFQL